MGLPVNHAAENALATLGAVLWSIQIIPQLVLSYRTKSTKGLSENLMLIWYLATLFLGAYLVAQRLSIPLQIQPQLFGLFSAMSYTQCLYYGRGFSKMKAGAVLFVLLAVFAGFEAGSVYALWRNGHEWPLLMYGYISAALLALGLAPQYWEIYKLRQVIGISLFFLSVDILGGIFSFLSLFFREDLDIAAFVSYAGVVVLDSLVILLAFILNPIAKRKGYWIGDKPHTEIAENGPADSSGTHMDVRPTRSRLSSTGAHGTRGPLHSISNDGTMDSTSGGALFGSVETQDTVYGKEVEKGVRSSRDDVRTQMRREAEARGAGGHAAGAEGMEAIRRVENRVGLT